MGFSCPRGWATEWRGKVSALRGGLPTGARAGLAARRRSRSQPMRLWCSSAERLTCVGKARLSYPKFPGGKWGISLMIHPYPTFFGIRYPRWMREAAVKRSFRDVFIGTGVSWTFFWGATFPQILWRHGREACFFERTGLSPQNARAAGLVRRALHVHVFRSAGPMSQGTRRRGGAGCPRRCAFLACRL